jgi:hypothetical protein
VRSVAVLWFIWVFCGSSGRLPSLQDVQALDHHTTHTSGCSFVCSLYNPGCRVWMCVCMCVCGWSVLHIQHRSKGGGENPALLLSKHAQIICQMPHIR